MAIPATARDMERAAVARQPRLRRPPAPSGEALTRPGLPFPLDISAETADALAELLARGIGGDLDLVAAAQES